MIYQFDDIMNEKLITDSRILFISGKYAVFNHIMADKMRDSCTVGEYVDLSGYTDFGDFSADTNESLSFDDYLTYCNAVNINGEWFCSVDYKTLTKKQKDALERHIKTPATHGRLVVILTDYKDTIDITKKFVKTSPVSNLIKLSYPRRKVLESIVTELFKKQGVEVTSQAVQLFIMRMGIAYDKYSEYISKLCGGRTTLDYDGMQAGMRGCTMYALGDLIVALLKPTKSDKVIKSRKAYKVLNTLVPELGAQTVLRNLHYEVKRMLEYRLYINKGAIPILVPYSIDRVKARIPETAKIYRVSEFTFKREAKIASKTTLIDWVYLHLIILVGLRKKTEIGAYRALLACIHRNAVTNDRLLNDLELKNVLGEALFQLNKMGVSTNDEYECKELDSSSS